MINRRKNRYENVSRLNRGGATEVFDNKTDMWVLLSSVNESETTYDSGSFSGNEGSFSGAGASGSYSDSSSNDSSSSWGD